MFKELHPLIQHRPLTITVASLGGGRVRVNVVPQALDSDSEVNDKIGHSNKDKIAKVPDSAITALTTPLSLTGTPEEIDAGLPQIVTQFAETHVQLQKTIEQAKEEIAEAVRVIQEREKTRPKSSSAAVKREEKPEKPAAGEGELLPLWCKPGSDASATTTNEKSAGSPTDDARASEQQTLNTQTMEEVTS